jgi:protein-S-isoprenylcysteine O-methyltransferase Ste14
MNSFSKSFLATTAFAVVHSSLASLAAKEKAAALVGTRNRDGLYRAAYLAQSFVTFGLLVAYISKLPKKEIYRASPKGALLLHAGQGAMLGFLTYAAFSAGVGRLTGFTHLSAWLRGDRVPSFAVAQGPEPAERGTLEIRGPFRRQRHPLNFGFLPIFWLASSLTTRRLGFNVAASAYLILGSALEEQRLSKIHGGEYERYRRSGPRFFLPGRTKIQSPSEASCAPLAS